MTDTTETATPTATATVTHGRQGDHQALIRRHACDSCGICGQEPVLTIDIEVEPRNKALADRILRFAQRVTDGHLRECEWTRDVVSARAPGPVQMTLREHVESLISLYRQIGSPDTMDTRLEAARRTYLTAANQLEDALSLATDL